MKIQNWLETSGWYLLLILFALVTALPFFWTGLMSVRENSSNIFRRNKPPEIIPYPGLIGWGEGANVARESGSYDEEGGKWQDYETINAERFGNVFGGYAFPATTENFYRVTQDVDITRYFMNSLFVAIATVILNIITCSLAAYPLAKLRFEGRDLVFTIILGTLVFPPQLIMIPLYVMSVNTFGFQDTFWGLILPFSTSAFGIFLLRQIYLGIPDELLEAARLDGATEFGIWWRILMPLIRPGIATLAIIVFINSWNDFLWPKLMLQDRDLFTLPIGLAYLRGFFSGSLRNVAAGIMIATIPMIVFFLMFQRQFIKGLSGAVKG